MLIQQIYLKSTTNFFFLYKFLILKAKKAALDYLVLVRIRVAIYSNNQSADSFFYELITDYRINDLKLFL